MNTAAALALLVFEGAGSTGMSIPCWVGMVDTVFWCGHYPRWTPGKPGVRVPALESKLRAGSDEWPGVSILVGA